MKQVRPMKKESGFIVQLLALGLILYALWMLMIGGLMVASSNNSGNEITEAGKAMNITAPLGELSPTEYMLADNWVELQEKCHNDARFNRQTAIDAAKCAVTAEEWKNSPMMQAFIPYWEFRGLGQNKEEDRINREREDLGLRPIPSIEPSLYNAYWTAKLAYDESIKAQVLAAGYK